VIEGNGILITDSQVHVWAAPSPERPWAEGGESYAEGVDNLSSAERKPLSPEELLTLMGPAGVDRVVLVPPVFAGDSNDLALRGARRWPERFAVMGRLALDDPASRQLVAGWTEAPGMLGVRLTFHWDKQQRWLDDGTADWFWPAAEQAGLPVMVYAPGALKQIRDVAARHPGLRLIVDHFGLPLEARDEDIPGVVDELVKLAPPSNVAVKASALPSYTRDQYPFPALHEPIRRVLEAFGRERVFWGSEMTRLRCPYREAVALFTEALTFLSDEDLRWVMGQGISEWLGWAPSANFLTNGGTRRVDA
jgi:predicted TIM-barrel fold metal-dependent hydrolase